MNTKGIIDQGTFFDLNNLMGEDFIGELIDTFSTETEELIAQLKEALENGDAAVFGRLAHSIKSSSASMGALNFSRQARELEMLGKSGTLDGAQPLLDTFAADFLVVKETLEELKK